MINSFTYTQSDDPATSQRSGGDTIGSDLYAPSVAGSCKDSHTQPLLWRTSLQGELNEEAWSPRTLNWDMSDLEGSKTIPLYPKGQHTFPSNLMYLTLYSDVTSFFDKLRYDDMMREFSASPTPSELELDECSVYYGDDEVKEWSDYESDEEQKEDTAWMCAWNDLFGNDSFPDLYVDLEPDETDDDLPDLVDHYESAADVWRMLEEYYRTPLPTDLTQHGDIEPNPGPAATVGCYHMRAEQERRRLYAGDEGEQCEVSTTQIVIENLYIFIVSLIVVYILGGWIRNLMIDGDVESNPGPNIADVLGGLLDVPRQVVMGAKSLFAPRSRVNFGNAVRGGLSQLLGSEEAGGFLDEIVTDLVGKLGLPDELSQPLTNAASNGITGALEQLLLPKADDMRMHTHKLQQAMNQIPEVREMNRMNILMRTAVGDMGEATHFEMMRARALLTKMFLEHQNGQTDLPDALSMRMLQPGRPEAMHLLSDQQAARATKMLLGHAEKGFRVNPNIDPKFDRVGSIQPSFQREDPELDITLGGDIESNPGPDCYTCGIDKPKHAFSGNQLRRKAGRKCAVCCSYHSRTMVSITDAVAEFHEIPLMNPRDKIVVTWDGRDYKATVPLRVDGVWIPDLTVYGIEPNPGPPPMTKSTWIRDLVADGDVESNPGPNLNLLGDDGVDAKLEESKVREDESTNKKDTTGAREPRVPLTAVAVGHIDTLLSGIKKMLDTRKSDFLMHSILSDEVKQEWATNAFSIKTFRRNDADNRSIHDWVGNAYSILEPSDSVGASAILFFLTKISWFLSNGDSTLIQASQTATESANAVKSGNIAMASQTLRINLDQFSGNALLNAIQASVAKIANHGSFIQQILTCIKYMVQFMGTPCGDLSDYVGNLSIAYPVGGIGNYQAGDWWPGSINANIAPLIEARWCSLRQFTNAESAKQLLLPGWQPSDWGHTCAVVPVDQSLANNRDLLTAWVMSKMEYPWREYVFQVPITENTTGAVVDPVSVAAEMAFGAYHEGPRDRVLLVSTDVTETDGKAAPSIDFEFTGGTIVNSTTDSALDGTATGPQNLQVDFDALNSPNAAFRDRQAQAFEAATGLWSTVYGNNEDWTAAMLVAAETLFHYPPPVLRFGNELVGWGWNDVNGDAHGDANNWIPSTTVAEAEQRIQASTTPLGSMNIWRGGGQGGQDLAAISGRRNWIVHGGNSSIEVYVYAGFFDVVGLTTFTPPPRKTGTLISMLRELAKKMALMTDLRYQDTGLAMADFWGPQNSKQYDVSKAVEGDLEGWMNGLVGAKKLKMIKQTRNSRVQPWTLQHAGQVGVGLEGCTWNRVPVGLWTQTLAGERTLPKEHLFSLKPIGWDSQEVELNGGGTNYADKAKKMIQSVNKTDEMYRLMAHITSGFLYAGGLASDQQDMSFLELRTKHLGLPSRHLVSCGGRGSTWSKDLALSLVALTGQDPGLDQLTYVEHPNIHPIPWVDGFARMKAFYLLVLGVARRSLTRGEGEAIRILVDQAQGYGEILADEWDSEEFSVSDILSLK